MATPELKKNSTEHLEYDDVEAKGEDPHHRVADQAAADFVDASVVITPEENKAMRMRIHKRILPLMCLAYFLQAIDKGTLGTSSIMGWQDDVGAKGQDYALTATFLWIGIIIGEPIVSPPLRMQTLTPRRTSACASCRSPSCCPAARWSGPGSSWASRSA